MGLRKRKKNRRIIIFGRYPMPGRVKTRLIPDLGALGACDLQRKLFEDIFHTVCTTALKKDIEVEVCFDGGDRRKMRKWLGRGAFFSEQSSGDLGERMYRAFINAFNRGCKKVVLIGTDIAELTCDDLEKAFDALTGKDLVLSPSSDGGYCLVGLKKSVNIFKSITWSSEKVLEQTMDMAKKSGLDFSILSPLFDIDTIDDVKKWRPGEAVRRPYISVIIPALNEADNIEAAITSAGDEDVEIIVVDGQSTDATIKRAKNAGARVEASIKGRGFQQNTGAKNAQGRVLLFLHADTILPDNFAAHVYEALMGAGVIVGAFRFKTDLNTPFMKIMEFTTNIRAMYFKLPYGDQGLFLKREIFQSAGGFPEVPIAEDLYLIRTLSKQGNIVIAPAPAITSSRRWQKRGVFRTMLINQIIAAGCFLGVSPSTLARLHRMPEENA
jgi:rSAM/selenodomain-associated transferase 2/rSAM/selenodomain-associated transferase 1